MLETWGCLGVGRQAFSSLVKTYCSRYLGTAGPPAWPCVHRSAQAHISKAICSHKKAKSSRGTLELGSIAASDGCGCAANRSRPACNVLQLHALLMPLRSIPKQRLQSCVVVQGYIFQNHAGMYNQKQAPGLRSSSLHIVHNKHKQQTAFVPQPFTAGTM